MERKFPLEALLLLWKHSFTTYDVHKDSWVPRARIMKLAQWLGPEFSWPKEAQEFQPPRWFNYWHEWDSLQLHFKVPANVLSYYACKWSGLQYENVQRQERNGSS